MAKTKKARTTKARANPYAVNPYPNYGRPLLQTRYEGCKCVGTCVSSTCPCAKSGTRCLHNCSCTDCIHHAPPCKCDTCGDRCPCRLSMHPCTDECGKKKGSKARTCDKETCSNIYQDRPLPKCKVKTSTIPGAGKGYFAREDIKKGQLIAKFGGRVVKDRGDHKYDGAMDLFEIAQGYSLKLDHKDAYFVNEAPGDKANAEFLITEGPERREVMLKAKRPIKIDQEIFAAYGPGQFFPWKTDEPDVDNYLQVMGEENGKDVAWLGKVTRVYGPGEFRVQWLLRKEDLSWLPEGLHVELEAGEHIMWHEEQDVGRDHFFRLVHCQEGRPGHLGRNKWWWTRRFDPEAERIVEE